MVFGKLINFDNVNQMTANHIKQYVLKTVFSKFSFLPFFTVFTDFTGKIGLFYHFTGKFKTL